MLKVNRASNHFPPTAAPLRLENEFPYATDPACTIYDTCSQHTIISRNNLADCSSVLMLIGLLFYLVIDIPIGRRLQDGLADDEANENAGEMFGRRLILT
ncbi:hypothetical protein GWI33_005715 [Rhynchophorus ferrugineus]|uniref:Uncharacterized protein n=1 Tax=Rhynchophorus ferrugineus TaxID=354439 RepID=A0A834ME83_RHYFE|nr:hypothetical protein GWI33_005715 [Rhynchophorus ferrugineus]